MFHDMETSESAVSTHDLTESFGWTAADSFQQHDLQELLRVLTDHLEERMKGTVLEKSIGQLLQVWLARCSLASSHLSTRFFLGWRSSGAVTQSVVT
jgi:hypothetical protein